MQKIASKICIGIDASRCLSGGALEYVQGLLNNFEPENSDAIHIHLWAHRKLSNAIQPKKWLSVHTPKVLDSHSLIRKLLWQRFTLKKSLSLMQCSILFTADASTVSNFTPQIVLSQDMLSYEPGVMKLFGLGFMRLRLIVIYYLQNFAFRRAFGVIFLTNYASQTIQKMTKPLNNSICIPHGINKNFFTPSQIHEFRDDVVKFLYVSPLFPYKNHEMVLEAFNIIVSMGLNVEITFIGAGDKKNTYAFKKLINKSIKNGVKIQYTGHIDHSLMPSIMSRMDVFVFSSSCENMPITLMEAMASEMPILCSNKGPMPEVLRNAGIYFDPANIDTLVSGMSLLVKSHDLRSKFGREARELAAEYSWKKTSQKTFKYLIERNESFKNG